MNTNIRTAALLLLLSLCGIRRRNRGPSPYAIIADPLHACDGRARLGPYEIVAEVGSHRSIRSPTASRDGTRTGETRGVERLRRMKADFDVIVNALTFAATDRREAPPDAGALADVWGGA